MKKINTTHILLITLLSIAIPPLALAGTCRDTCGAIPIKYPFGSGSGCGHPYFSRYVKCAPGGALHLSTAAAGGAAYAVISSIDYAAGALVAADPLMSTCAAMQDSGGFALDRGSPFSVAADNIFALLGCSATSPVFDPDADFCDTGSGRNVCRGLYTCEGVAGIGLEPHAPVSTCCVYEPPVSDGSGSGLGLDLPKLQCSSYSSVYGFGGNEGDPMRWQYGILLRFNDSYYSSDCRNCEESGGFCGFQGLEESFSCKCRNGVNTTVNCYGRGNGRSGGAGRDGIQTALNIGGFLLLWMISFF
ncbi:uncharacterized protein LOC131025145 [Salvia miltiorrhiza]|uniref:uncharacterized protein LOC131025145 n=1 Tax=Salvia miltiorrhiza TaxID=226208 RepID=UPI0025AC8C04|nr:uncharacterized protein LOC131025145 [Salvia miltiorrhiza]